MSSQKVFISYARKDDEPFADRLHADLVAHGFDVWWDRASMPSRGLTLSQEIRDAIESSDRVLLVVGPAAAASEYVRFEWQHARLFAKSVVPLLRLGDHALIPDDLRSYHCPDCRESRPYPDAFAELLRVLQDPLPVLGPLLTEVPALPPHFLYRKLEMDWLCATVLADTTRPTVITSQQQTNALQGMGGIGKSVLAAAFARATTTRLALPDGILWLTAGQDPDPLATLRRALTAVGSSTERLENAVAARDRLAQTLQDKSCLIVLDDVWFIEQAQIFRNAIGPRSRLLITTRDSAIVTALGSNGQYVDVLGSAQAAALLAQWSGTPLDRLPEVAMQLARACGFLPLALALSGALVSDGLKWTDVLQALQAAELEFLDHPHGSVMRSIRISIDALPFETRRRYLGLAVFPRGEGIPEEAIVSYWSGAFGLPARSVRKLLVVLRGKALLSFEDTPGRRFIRLHDLHHDFLQASCPDTPALHQSLVTAYASQCHGDWPDGPNDGYFFRRLATHLLQADRQDDLRSLLLNYRWLRARISAGEIDSLLRDYKLLPGASSLDTVASALRLSAYTLESDPDQIASQLLGRLLGESDPAIQDLLADATRLSVGCWLRPLRRCLSPTAGPLVRMIKTGASEIEAIALSGDLTIAFVPAGDAFRDKVASIAALDVRTGEILYRITGLDCRIEDIQTTQDDRYLAVVGHDMQVHLGEDGKARSISYGTYSVLVYDLRTRALAGRTLVGSRDDCLLVLGSRILARAEQEYLEWSPADNQFIAARPVPNSLAAAAAVRGEYAVAPHDGNLAVWHLPTMTEHARTSARSSDDCDVSLDGRTLAVFRETTNTVELWDTASDRCTAILNLLEDDHDKSYGLVALFSRGRKLVTVVGGYESTSAPQMKVWSVPDGKLMADFSGLRTMVSSIAAIASGEILLTGTIEGEVYLWNGAQAEDQTVPSAHTKAVSAVAFSPDGQMAGTASADGSIALWNVVAAAEIVRTQAHRAPANDLVFLRDEPLLCSVSDDATIQLRHIADLAAPPRVLEAAGAVVGITSHPEDHCVAVSCRTGPIEAWDLRSNSRRVVFHYQGDVVSRPGRVAFAKGGALLLLASRSYGGAYTPDFLFEAMAIDFSTGKVISGIPARGTDGFTAIASTIDGSNGLASNRGSLQMWNFVSRESRQLLNHSGNEITSIRVFSDGCRVLTSAYDGVIRISQLDAGAEIARIQLDNSITAAALSPCNRYVVAGDLQGAVHFFVIAGA